jgi:hypothetical protein
MATADSTLTIEATDVTQQKHIRVSDLSEEATVGELVDGLIRSLNMPALDAEARPLSYHARLEREGRQLHASETVGEALRPGDLLTVLPNIEAGCA